MTAILIALALLLGWLARGWVLAYQLRRRAQATHAVLDRGARTRLRRDRDERRRRDRLGLLHN